MFNSNKFFMALKMLHGFIIPSNEYRAHSKPILAHYNFLLSFYDLRRSFAYIMSIQSGDGNEKKSRGNFLYFIVNFYSSSNFSQNKNMNRKISRLSANKLWH